MFRGSSLAVTGLDVLPVRVGPRAAWLFVRLSTNRGLTGLGEASLGAATR